jgi:autotransporter translocation and assembly factor TamB
VALVLFAFRGALVRSLVGVVAGALTGDRIGIGDLSLSARRIVLSNVAVSRGGAPLFAADRIDVRYDLHELIFGGERRYGLSSISLEGPRVTIVRHADGSFDLANHGGAGAPAVAGAAPSEASAAPLRFTLAVREGSVVLVDPGRALPIARNLAVDEIAANADVDDASRTTYGGSGRFAHDDRQRVTFAGRVDADGFASHRLRAAYVALPPIVNYFINTRSAELLRGEARDVDVRAYAFPTKAGAPYHVTGRALVAGGAMRVPGLVVDATDMHGSLDAFDGGIATRGLDANLGPIAVRLAGGLYDWADPAFRLGVRSDADLNAVRSLFRFSRRLPLHGAAALSTLLEGSVGDPLVATRIDAPALSYARFPVSNASGRAIYYDSDVDVVDARGTYGGLDVRADGGIELGSNEPVTQLAVDATGPARGVPYAAQLAPDATLRGDGLLAGTGLAFDARGVVVGDGGGVTLTAPFHVDPHGDGRFGPIDVADRDGAELAGTYYLERSQSSSGFWLDARHYPFAELTPTPRLPGLDLVAPAFAGRLDGRVAGVGPPSAFRIAGHVRGSSLRVGSVAIDDVAGDVSGAFGNVRLSHVAARGPWGRFGGNGAYAGGRLALEGRYDGSFERLRTFTGDLGGAGGIAGPVALLLDPHATVVQTSGAASVGSTVHGVPVDRVTGTLEVADRRFRIDAATATVAGGTLAAAGSLGGPGGIGVSVFGADAARMHGVPLERGSVAAIGDVTSRNGVATFDGGLSVGGGVASQIPVAGNGDLTFSPGHLELRKTDARAAGIVAALAGSVSGVGSGEPLYDVRLAVPSAGMAPIVRALGVGGETIAGTIDGDVRVRGPYDKLALEGRVGMPEGTIAGLAFADASANVSVDRAGVRARAGRVTVGSTQAAFSALYRGDDNAIRVVAPHANLSDFNDLFDEGDTLGGKGRVALRFSKRGTSTRTNADIAIAGLRYRSFDLGDARAVWSSHGRSVVGSVLFGGASGRLAASGTLVLSADAAVSSLMRDSRFDGTAELAGLDLGVWLPALGYQIPIGGRVDANATIAGPLSNPVVTTVATLRDGSIGKFPVDRLTVEANSTLDRTNVRRVDLELPSVSVLGSGRIGHAPGSPLDLSLHATSSNLGGLTTRLFGAAYPVTGAGAADVTVDGTRDDPRVTGRVDVRSASVRGVAIPQADAAFALRGRAVVLSEALVRFTTGTLALHGSVPFEIQPFALGPPAAPIGLDFAATDLELADFAPLLPPGSQLAGRIDGTLQVGGSAGAPHLGGLLTLASGTFQSPLETVALTDVAARLRFDGSSALLDSFHAAAGGGTIDASGSAKFADSLVSGGAVAYDFVASADKLRLDLPAYGSGTVDGTVSLARLAGRPAKIAGDLRLSDGTIPFSALLVAGGGGGFDTTAGSAQTGGLGPPRIPRDTAFDLDLSAERNVRVRSGNVDIGARGDLHVNGTVDQPSLAGGFVSTGGTITYFNTVFRLVDGKVTFTPDQGVIPTLDAVATTQLINPDPNTVRNVTGSANVTLTLAGPVTNLTIGLKSDPSYDRAQILGLLLNAPALGASNLFGETPGQAVLYGSNSLANLSPGVAGTRSQSGELSVAQEAFGVANAQFTRTLLAPIETTFAQAVGLSNFNVNVGYTGGVGLSARKILGRNVNAIYGTTFGYPYRQTFGFDIKENDSTAAQVTVFQTLGEYGLSSTTPTTLLTSTGNLKYNAAQPSAGTAGFSFSIQHLF